ncbi:MAG: hypothetical protein ACJ8FY_02425 [Gemmataceae bacterium]
MESFLVFLLCLIPVILYCLFFAWINSRERGLLVNGSWDFVGILFATSAFLIVGGPAILEGVFDRFQQAQVRFNAPFRENLDFYIWNGMKLIYFAGVVGVCAWVLRRRQKLTLAYNVDPESFSRQLFSILDKKGLSWLRSENSIFVKNAFGLQGSRNGLVSELPRTAESKTAALAQRQRADQIQRDPEESPVSQEKQFEESQPGLEVRGPETEACNVMIRLESSFAMRNVALHWEPANLALREQIEVDLMRARARFAPHYNPVGFWLLCTASLLILAVFSGGAVILVSSLTR